MMTLSFMLLATCAALLGVTIYAYRTHRRELFWVASPVATACGFASTMINVFVL